MIRIIIIIIRKQEVYQTQLPLTVEWPIRQETSCMGFLSNCDESWRGVISLVSHQEEWTRVTSRRQAKITSVD